MADDKGTTQKEDVSTEIEVEEEVKGKPAYLERGEMMEKLATQREDDMIKTAEEAGAGHKLRENIEGAREKKPEEKPPEKPEETPPEKPDEDSKKEDEELKVSRETHEIEEEQIEIKVYGKTKFYPKSQVEAHGGKVAFQKTLAADYKMEQAAKKDQAADERQREQDEREQYLKEWEQRLGQPQPAEADRTVQMPTQDDVATLKKRLDEVNEKHITDLMMGDTEEAIKSGAELEEARADLYDAQRRAESSATVFAAQRVAAEQEEAVMGPIRKRLALPPEEGGFRDVLTDPRGWHLAWLRIEQHRLLGHDTNTWEFNKEILEEVRKDIALDAQSTEPKKETPKELNPEKGEEILTEKLEKKKTIDVIDTASKRETMPEKEQPSEEAGRQAGLEYIQKSRGGG